MANTMSGIEAGLSEARGEGQLSAIGRKITFRRNDGMVFSWSAATDKAAHEQLAFIRQSYRHGMSAAELSLMTIDQDQGR